VYIYEFDTEAVSARIVPFV